MGQLVCRWCLKGDQGADVALPGLRGTLAPRALSAARNLAPSWLADSCPWTFLWTVSEAEGLCSWGPGSPACCVP